MNPLLLLIAILPGLLISLYIYFKDKYEKEAHWPLIICFLLGMLSTLPAMWCEAQGAHLENVDHFGTLLFFAFIVVAFSEEFAKFICLMGYPFPRPFFNEPLDGIIYSMMIGMGFATLENILYADRFGFNTILIRAFTAVPAHAVFAIIMGYYVGLAKFDIKNRLKLIGKGLGLAVFLHGLYDFFIIQQYYEWLMGFATITLAIGLIFVRKLVQLHQINSPFQEEEQV